MSYKIKTAVIIGSGNVAWHLGKVLLKNTIEILQIIGKSVRSTQKLANELRTPFTIDLNQIQTNADIYIISVSDDSIEDVIKKLNLTDQLIVHTSGTTSISVFEKYFTNYGVLYPLQTFSKNREIDFNEIPIFIEGNSDTNQKRISNLAELISQKVIAVNSVTRAKLHLAAVFACNFTNHMYAIAEHLMQSEKLDFLLLQPLIMETSQKAMEMKPKEAQTGPAVRKDFKLMEKHLKILEKEPLLKEIYTLLSRSIQN